MRLRRRRNANSRVCHLHAQHEPAVHQFSLGIGPAGVVGVAREISSARPIERPAAVDLEHIFAAGLHLARAGLNITGPEYLLIRIGAVALGALIGLFRFGFSFGPVILGAVGFFLPPLVIAYLQRLGSDIKAAPAAPPAKTASR